MRHYNTAISRGLQNTLNLKGESLPDEVDDIIVPTINASPSVDVVAYAQNSNATSTTIMTTAADRDFYLCAIMLSHANDSGALTTHAGVTAIIDGTTQLLIHTTLSGTINYTGNPVYMPLPTPIKIDRNTIIAIVHTNATAVTRTTATIYGYYRQ